MTKLAQLFVAVCLASGLLTGCCAQEKKRIAMLNTRVQQLQADKAALQGQVRTASAGKSSLQAQIEARDEQIANLNREVERLRETGRGTGTPLTVPTRSPEGPVGPSATGWERGRFGDRVTVGADLLFLPGQAALKRGAESSLASIAGELNSTYSGQVIRVYGYTDTDPLKRTKQRWTDNLNLSAQRAMSVTRYLIGTGKVDPRRIETVAMGPWHPLETKKASRRVEIIVVKAR